MSTCQLTVLFYIPINVYMSILVASFQLILNIIALGLTVINFCGETRTPLFL